ncbi:putative mitochondrial protein [Sesamum angolense]|uniref:Mitochondrial protein n=1 Tax=Sesamum angolense TaxID=2727404 RepID=A0AAE1VXZ7_9LAMI|nr:putative mitochondrial protein [Sesamum angolense]
MVANFWWYNGETRKTHWINWKKLCIPKSQGGMGFRDLQAFNLAMLSKQLWRIILNPGSLLSRVLRAKYFPNGQALLAPVGRNPSYTWRSIQAAQQVVRGGLRWRICSGRSIRIWGDPWIPRPFSFSVLSSPTAASPDMRVCDLIDATSKEWNHGLLQPCPYGALPLVPSPPRWSPPDRSVIKLNFDGATFASSSEFGLGVITRNSLGECIGWKVVRKKGLHKPEMVEAFAAREAILIACGFGWKEIILEGDCATLYFKLSSSQPDCSDSSAIIRDIKFLASGFDSCSFSLIRRTGNKAAHWLARQASSLASEGDCLPPLLSAYLLSDED